MLNSYDIFGNLDSYDKCHSFLGFRTVSLTLPHGTDKARANKEILLNKTWQKYRVSIKIFSLKSQPSSQNRDSQDLPWTAIGNFLRNILPNNSTLHSGHLLWGHLLQRTHFWHSLGQQQAIDEKKKCLKGDSLFLIFFYFLLKIWIKQKSFWLVKNVRYLKKNVIYFVGRVP